MTTRPNIGLQRTSACVLADPHRFAAAVADPRFWGNIMGDVRPGQMVGNLPAAVPLLSLARGQFLGRRGIG